jgi:NAD(P)-dependent dehydrogenase (short-subunit alcohol dehydrogenase family)
MADAQKVVIVTGASQGIGAGIVEGYRAAGYAVVANSRSIQKSSDPGVLTVAGDIGESAVAESLAQTAIDHFGRIDTLVNNAGMFIGKPFASPWDHQDADARANDA